MKFAYAFPFLYFFDTRLRQASVSFHVIFEWIAAAVLVCTLGKAEPVQALMMAALSYLAFISLYEMGYLVNDLFNSHKEAGGRKRGPQDAGAGWISVWFASRAGAFLVATALAGQLQAASWWSYFAALCGVFALHNFLTDRDMKAATFLWLAWFRFMAPVIFVIEDSQRMGVALAASMTYVAFRLFGYLDGKGMLNMPQRQSKPFRALFFALPLLAGLPLLHFPGSKGFLVLIMYFAFAALAGTLFAYARDALASKKEG